MTASVEHNGGIDREIGSFDGPILWLSMANPGARMAGSSTYSGGLMTAAAEASLSITLASFGDGPPLPRIAMEPLPQANRLRALSLASSLPASVWALAAPAARRRLRAILANRPWAAVVIDHAAMAWAMPLVEAARLPLVYVSHNHEASIRPAVAYGARPGLKRALMRLDAAKFARLESQLVQAACLVTAITDEDAMLYRHQQPGKSVITLTPGYGGRGSDPPRRITTQTPRRVLLVGRYDWVAKQANLSRWAAKAVPLFGQRRC
ncbi:MAG: hypothetical protein ACKVGZ_02560 [Alphaproteobacteria bacterium]